AACGRTAVRREALEDGKRKGGGLPGAGLGDAEQVASGGDGGNGLGLDGRRALIDLGRERLPGGGGEGEGGKLGQVGLSFVCATTRARSGPMPRRGRGFGNAPRELGRLGGNEALSAGRWPAPGEAAILALLLGGLAHAAGSPATGGSHGRDGYVSDGWLIQG